MASTEEDLPKKMPVAERAARQKEHKARLRGLTLEGEFECSHSLLDSVAQQYDRDEIRYLCLSVCATREGELNGHKKDAHLTIDGDTLGKSSCS